MDRVRGGEELELELELELKLKLKLELELVGEDEDRPVGRWNFSSCVKAVNAKFQC